jgi:small-conductance mechanosensitive channel
MTLSELSSWILSHGLALLLGGLLLFAAYRIVEALIPRAVRSLVQVQQATLVGAEPTDEVQKRVRTLEIVLLKLVRAGFVIGIVLLVLGVFDLFGVLAGLGLIGAALTLAGQAIVLDYLMGILILVEGPYYKGDWIAIRGVGVDVEGEVQEIGLRRTTLRDPFGALHSVSNGLIRASTNSTRVFSLATAEVQIAKPADIDRAIAVAGRVARELGEERGWAGRPDEAPVATSVTALTLGEATIRVQLRVPPGSGIEAMSELRRRLYAAFAAESIGTEPPAEPPPASDL